MKINTAQWACVALQGLYFLLFILLFIILLYLFYYLFLFIFCKDFTFYYLFFIYYCMFSWLLVRPQRTPERTPLENNSRYYSSCIVRNVMLQVLKLLSSVCLCYMHVLVSAASCIINDRPLVL